MQNHSAVPLRGEGSKSCPQRVLAALLLCLLPDSSSSVSPSSAGSLGSGGLGKKEEVLMGRARCALQWAASSALGGGTEKQEEHMQQNLEKGDKTSPKEGRACQS